MYTQKGFGSTLLSYDVLDVFLYKSGILFTVGNVD